MSQISPLDFFRDLVWLDGRPLLDTIEPYRRRMFDEALYSFLPDGRPRYDRVVKGVAKKNNKSTDLALAVLYRFFCWETLAGNDCYVIANDEDQAGDNLDLIKKLIGANAILGREVKVYAKEIARLDGRGTLKILPAQDALGAHGKTFLVAAFDEIHGYKNYDLFEALSPDPTRRDVLTYITSYAGIRHAPGIPLYDLFQIGKAGTDPRLHFSWYAADYTTDERLAGEDVTPEQRANPSMASWDVPDYLEQQRLRLPTSKFRRLHLNLPGSPDGSAFSAEHVMAAIVTGRRRLPYRPGIRYVGAVDMSGGSNDDSTFAIAHRDPETDRAVLDLLVSQTGRPPFDPRQAAKKFAALAHEYGIGFISGDNYSGMTFRFDFLEHGLSFDPIKMPRALGVRANTTPTIPRQERSGGQPSASDFYEAFEPRLNAGEVELLDIPELQEQLLTLIWKGAKITHETGGHDDWANAAAIALVLAVPARPGLNFSPAFMARARNGGRPFQPGIGPTGMPLPPELLPPAQPPAPASRGRLYVSDALRARIGRRLPMLGKF